MEREVEVVDTAGAVVPVLVTAGAAATVGDLRAVLGIAAVPLRCDGVSLPDEARLDEVHLPVGARLHGGVAGPLIRRDGDWELAVAGGLGAGETAPVTDGPVTLGRDRCAGLTVADPEVSREHAVVVPEPGGARLTDAGSRNGTSWQGYRLTGPVTLGDGDVFLVGESAVALRRPVPADATVEPDPAGGTVRFNRPPRLSRPVPPPDFAVPTAPGPPRGFRLPLVAALVPLALAGAVYALAPSAGYYLIFLVLSPVLLLVNAVTDQRSGRREYRRAKAAYDRELAELTERLRALAAEQGRCARGEAPDPAAVRWIATGPTQRLFERRPADPDFLRLRVGLADRPVTVRLTGADGFGVPDVLAAPVTIDLPVAGVVGLAGPRTAVLAAARAALCQLATLHAPPDLQVVLLAGRERATDWEWASWLPHTRATTAGCRRLLATDAAQAALRVDELRKLVAQRRSEQRTGLNEGVPVGPRVLLVVDGARRMRAVDGLADLLSTGPTAGVYALCLDERAAELPDECGATVEVTSVSGTRATVSSSGTPPIGDVLLDGVPADVAATVARALAPVQVLGGRGDESALPDAVRLLELAGLENEPDPVAIAEAWAREPGGSGVLLGVGPAGPVTVDLRRDGPHALVAGTSGAGKSELLQTLVTGLALGHPPDALSVVLVDYKGGSAFGACRDLPHCAGLVTDLDTHLVGRALDSLSAELRRREALLAAADAKDIDDFWAGGGRLARLVIVIDEFASLVAEVPEFVSGVVGIGMRGRSLGVHVVLATQRPAGVVSAELRANVNLRICLRVTSVEESRDVLDVTDAARLSRRVPGRGYLRTGHGELTVLQTARINAPRRGTGADDRQVSVLARRVTDLGAPIEAPGTEPGHDGDTDLSVLVAAVRTAAELAGRQPAPSPWLPPLPELVTVAELDAAPTGSLAVARPVAAPIGLADYPRQQVQRPYWLDLAGAAPVAVAGMARSGRSTLLRTLAAGLAARSGPGDVHLYVLDFGNRALAPLADLPHCGAYVTGDDPERTGRLLAALDTEVRARQRVFAAGGYADLAEQRTGPDPLPYLVLLVDGYEGFVAANTDVEGGRRVDALDGLLRAGPAVGILVVLATDASGFTHRLAGAMATRLVLRHADRDDLAAYGIQPRTAPTSLPHGRVLVAPDGPAIQVALLSPEPDGAAQSEAVRHLAGALAGRWDGVPAARVPRRVDPLPAEIGLAELTRPGVRAPGCCVVGAGGDQLGPVEVDLVEAGAFLVAGPLRAGRSTALHAIVASLAGRVSGELPVALVCPRSSPLRDLAGQPGIVAVLTGVDVASELDELMATRPRLALVVDDAELHADGPASPVLERFVRYARDDGGVVVAAGTTDDLHLARHRGWLAGVRRVRTGLLLAPASSVDGELFDLRLPRGTGLVGPPGRGLLVARGATTPIQVPLPDPVCG